ncbi:PUA-like domain-containing protein [Amylocarpus encephaloides]|uniref:Thymocyte nuclear protein 1 n=1 Tax=Amylocarpus encephaloides TaxID=45428 RepID=A0A9P7YMX9_9HELO|nr:PUA-like domain-containing protein [Amylocarpus encephaloides]
MPKRKMKEAEIGEVKDAPRRSSRRTSTQEVKKEAQMEAPAPAAKKSKKARSSGGERVDEPSKEEEEEATKSKSTEATNITKAQTSAPTTNGDVSTPGERQYWLMKAEPESRMEKGHDIKFSIDDLAAKTEPEPWDGIRNFAARNNLRAMKKGDMAFFYHSSCKVPAIVGTMDIVQEHTPDLSAHNPHLPYHDPKSTPDNPKWSVVHVTFRQKLKIPITLKELKEWQGVKGHPLENMQMLRLARMSVSKVERGEWEFLVREIGGRGDVVV